MKVEQVGVFTAHITEEDDTGSLNATPQDREKVRRILEWQNNSQETVWPTRND